MGAKAPAVRQKLRLRGTLKCEFCGRKVLNSQALRAHVQSVHSSALKAKEKLQKPRIAATKVSKPVPVVPKPVQKAAVKKIDKKKPVLKVVSKVKPKMQAPKEKDKILPIPPTKKSADAENTHVRTTEFRCPKCTKIFTTYFSAFKHIQKRHCENSKGEKVAPDSIALLKPIRVEQCVRCDEKYDSAEKHKCRGSDGENTGLVSSFVCAGCDEQFECMKLFDVHVSGVHSDNAEILFFNAQEEFSNWKSEMETQTTTKYLLVGKNNNKKIYRCSNSSADIDENVTSISFCPSTIVTQEYAKGIQIQYYKDHYKHDFEEYKLAEKFKTYSLTDLLKQASNYEYSDSTELPDENDLYLQFKTLMEGIVLDAAKVNIDTLKLLIGEALDMTSVLRNYDEDGELLTIHNRSTLSVRKGNSNATSEQVLKAIEELRSQRKRKVSEVSEDNTRNLRNKATQQEVKSPILNTATSKSFSLADGKDTDKILKELDSDRENVKNGTDGIKSLVSFKTETPSFNDTYKQFIDKAIDKKIRLPEPRKKLLKTRMGQFKPNVSPKANERSKLNERPKRNVKELKYEVKERENDCNILILKI